MQILKLLFFNAKRFDDNTDSLGINLLVDENDYSHDYS